MASYQKVIIAGNIGKDVELKTTAAGLSFVKFGVAVSDNYLSKSGEKVETTEWFNCAFWGKQAETIAQYFSKGSSILVEGVMKTSKYTDKDGVERSSTDLVGKEFKFLDKKSSSQGAQAPAQQAASSLDDIPF